MIARRPETHLRVPLGVSAIVHAGLIALLVVVRAPRPAPMPPMYRVNLVAAPRGERAIGTVQPTPAAPAPTPAAPPRRAETKPSDMPAPTKTKQRAAPAPGTPNVVSAPAKKDQPAPAAGGGPTGDRGTDVATVN